MDLFKDEKFDIKNLGVERVNELDHRISKVTFEVKSVNDYVEKIKDVLKDFKADEIAAEIGLLNNCIFLNQAREDIKKQRLYCSYKEILGKK